jgi:hypothetical protein
VVTAMLDERHVDLLTKLPNDTNTYTLGSIGKHNIVIACLLKGKLGTSSIAFIATQMVRTFPSIKISLIIGISGGIPLKVQLGDVVINIPVGQFPSIVQWDFDKAKESGNFKRTKALNNPLTSLLITLIKLKTEHELNGPKMLEYLNELKKKYPLTLKYLRSDSLINVLFKANYSHVDKTITNTEVPLNVDDKEEEEESCRFCD